MTNGHSTACPASRPSELHVIRTLSSSRSWLWLRELRMTMLGEGASSSSASGGAKCEKESCSSCRRLPNSLEKSPRFFCLASAACTTGGTLVAPAQQQNCPRQAALPLSPDIDGRRHMFCSSTVLECNGLHKLLYVASTLEHSGRPNGCRGAQAEPQGRSNLNLYWCWPTQLLLL